MQSRNELMIEPVGSVRACVGGRWDEGGRQVVVVRGLGRGELVIEPVGITVFMHAFIRVWDRTSWDYCVHACIHTRVGSRWGGGGAEDSGIIPVAVVRAVGAVVRVVVADGAMVVLAAARRRRAAVLGSDHPPLLNAYRPRA